jgi:hypothetical protein
MPLGPGKADHIAEMAREAAKADGVVVLVFGGPLHGGFSVKGPIEMHIGLPSVLRQLADKIQADLVQQAAEALETMMKNESDGQPTQ